MAEIVIDVQPDCLASEQYARFVLPGMIEHLNNAAGDILVLYNDRSEPPALQGDDEPLVREFLARHGLRRPAHYVAKSYGYLRWVRCMSDDQIVDFLRLMRRRGITDARRMSRNEIKSWLNRNKIDRADVWDSLPIWPERLVETLCRYNGGVVHGGSTYPRLREIEILMRSAEIPVTRGKYLICDPNFGR